LSIHSLGKNIERRLTDGVCFSQALIAIRPASDSHCLEPVGHCDELDLFAGWQAKGAL
jgi:hypothetical protein